MNLLYQYYNYIDKNKNFIELSIFIFLGYSKLNIKCIRIEIKKYFNITLFEILK